MSKIRTCLIAMYAIGAIFTFGKVYHLQDENMPPDVKVSGAVLASMVWPFSLSAIAQSK